MRTDGRTNDQLRPFSIEPDFIQQALGSALVTAGKTRVICTASVEERTPGWLDEGGWITAEYAMMPGSTTPRVRRKSSGRDKEIQRLIGRSLRAGVNLKKLTGPQGGIAIYCDCDVIEADGGTRTAGITGAYVALQRALFRLRETGRLVGDPIIAPVAAVSVGLIGEASTPMLDLCYQEDSRAVVDMNVVMRGEGFVEIQGTGEDGTFSRDHLGELLGLAEKGIAELQDKQRGACLG